MDLDARVQLAHGDAWQAEGRLRARFGGGARELAGARLSSSGLPHPQWNNGDLVDSAQFDLAEVHAWYAQRAHGAGVPWGMRVPAGVRFPHGRFLFTKRRMGLLPAQFVRAPMPQNVELIEAAASEVQIVACIDATAFDEPVDHALPWIAPHIGARGFSVAIARQDGEPVGTATAVHSDDRAGRCVGIFGVGVLAHARGRGIGTVLTSWLIERAFAAGATLAHLNPNDEAAARIYRRLGFCETSGFDIYVDL
jgi:ribosomal protein S18 acetylase RimI-like enzyme